MFWYWAKHCLAVLSGMSAFSWEKYTAVENPLESDPIVVLVIDPPPSFISSKKQKQAEVTKNHSSLLSIQVFPFSKGGSLSRTKVSFPEKS